ncbi:MAG: bifunctional methionine sulfoxide reductase B/A protein [Bacteroidales bacterium]|nr:bifunctional methionine sulfoxide reductase B/A protein [Bacteroidales bacterium]
MNLSTRNILVLFFLIYIPLNMKAQASSGYNKLTEEESFVILQKGTEQPFTGKYYTNTEDGTYSCKQCDAALYKSSDKFDAHCGWPSFDDEIEGAIKKKTDADNRRTEILCSNCGAHLGHVFVGEQFTDKNTRHCVNSISLNFQALVLPTTSTEEKKTDTAIYAGGCFWGMEYYFNNKKGVLSTRVGYIGGYKDNPSYEEVCMHTTGHIEAIEVVFDPTIISYEKLTKLFFEIHDPTQVNRQGPDVGEQYKSAIFYKNDEQKETSEKLIKILKDKGLNVVTDLILASKFWPAEDYHQNYYDRNGNRPYCHFYQKKF